ncbi:hypothetical protein FPOAC1_004157 [Fusarium poae]|uniref:hypothetical protein n=1 Tax=Fusarium poae TaxID=36050 RepID=UPI001CE8DF45|nr:hypothetical protein FPOAC1_004157 [Fusarium poae]KAG8670922.1 hypothetical protein FPOAC1_004157 [Fusarium poae]
MEALRLLGNEAERQLSCQRLDGSRDPAIMDANQQMRDNDYYEKLSSLQQQIIGHVGNESIHWCNSRLHHASLLWQLPSFCNDGIVVRQRAIKKRNWALRTSAKLRIYDTDDIWRYSESVKRLEKFSIEMIDRLESAELVLYLLKPLPDGLTELSTFKMIDVLRQLVIQSLQALNTETTFQTLGFLAKLRQNFESREERHWYRLLADLLILHPRVTIIIDVGILRQNFQEADAWPAGFANLLQLLEDKTYVKMMLVTGHPMTPPDDPVVRSIKVGHITNRGFSPRLPMRRLRDSAGSEEGRQKPHNTTRDQGNSNVTNDLAFFNSREGEIISCGSINETNPLVEDATLTDQSEHTIAKPSNNSDASAHGLTGMLDKYSQGAFQASADDSETRSTTRWFKLLRDRTHEFLYRQGLESISAVKIAVLDTGFAYESPEEKRALKPYYQRIKKCVNFIDGDPDSKAKTDPSGHGTAVAVQILKVSLTAVLYICRVVRSDGVPDKAAVEKAIRIAAAKPTKDSPEGWGVDIINMSFGWPFSHEGVRDAIHLARQDGVHMFASTSNDGLLGDILYPARDENVIAVDAAGGFGEHAGSAPSSTSEHSRGLRFSAPGMGITSPNTKTIYSGSSFACPIAAGVTALILEFARQSPLSKSPDVQVYLKRMPAILAMLRRASVEKGGDGVKFLTPWELIGNIGEKRLITAWNVVRELQREYGLQVTVTALVEPGMCLKPLS